MKFGMYDTNYDGLVDSSEYARGEYQTEHRCKFLNHINIFFESYFIDGF